ncbi:MAG: hypothetical protein ACRD2X_05995, partial [Vicinamibacteraceae bacterium]
LDQVREDAHLVAGATQVIDRRGRHGAAQAGWEGHNEKSPFNRWLKGLDSFVRRALGVTVLRAIQASAPPATIRYHHRNEPPKLVGS